MEFTFQLPKKKKFEVHFKIDLIILCKGLKMILF